MFNSSNDQKWRKSLLNSEIFVKKIFWKDFQIDEKKL